MENSVVVSNQISEFDKYNAFLKEALYRCANLTTPYDRPTEVPITANELEKFCDAAVALGLPVIFVAEDDKGIGYYAGYPNFDVLNELESYR